jgi:DNA-binding CsgD family transcriptional regulator
VVARAVCHAIVVSHEGKIIDPSQFERTRREPLPVGAHVVTALGIHEPNMAARLRDAILAAVRERRTSSLRWRTYERRLGTLLTVQPAPEPGLALVSVSDLDKPLGAIAPELLTEIFDLTRAEAEIAVGLFQGLDLVALAVRRNVGLATVRGQTKALLHKVGVSSQRHLMLVLSRIAAVIPPAKLANEFPEQMMLARVG